MIERDVERHLVRAVEKELGGRCWKWVSPGMAGVPDRIVLLPHGLTYFVELKKPGEQPRSLQKIVHKMMGVLDHHVVVLDSIEAVDGFVREAAVEIRRKEREQIEPEI